MKVLIVDDSATVRLSVEMALQNVGIEVLSEDNPVIVPMRIGKDRPGLVLMDVEMPLLKGNKLTQILTDGKDLDARPLIILYSSLSEEKLARLANDSGADGFICKTSNYTALAARVIDWLAEGKA